MTIRQQGGVFGRNPKFNDVDATNVNADDITVADDLIVGDKIGVGGITVPQAPLHLSGAGNLIRLQQDGAYIQWEKTDGTDTGYIEASASGFNIAAQGALDLRLIQGGAERCRVNDNGIAMANGKGIDFSATSGTGTSELFDDYEEGTWTVTDNSGAGLTFTNNTGYYTKVGRFVTAIAAFTFPSTADGSNASIGGLPFTTLDVQATRASGVITYSNFSSSHSVWLYVSKGGTSSLLIDSAANPKTNANLSGKTFYVQFNYQT